MNETSTVLKIIVEVGSAFFIIGNFIKNLIKSEPEKIIENRVVKLFRIALYEIFFAIYILAITSELSIYTYVNSALTQNILSIFLILILFSYIIFDITEDKNFYYKNVKMIRNPKVMKGINHINHYKIRYYSLYTFVVIVVYVSLVSSYMTFYNTEMLTSYNNPTDIINSTQKNYVSFILKYPEENISLYLKEAKSYTVFAMISIYILTRFFMQKIISSIRRYMNRNSTSVYLNDQEIENLIFLNYDNDNYIFENKIGCEYLVIPKSSIKYIKIQKNKKIM